MTPLTLIQRPSLFMTAFLVFNYSTNASFAGLLQSFPGDLKDKSAAAMLKDGTMK